MLTNWYRWERLQKKIKEILDYPEIERNGKSVLKKDMVCDISFSNLLFSYDETKNDIDVVNLEIKEKTMTAIIGTSGSGKSTLMKLLAGFWDFERGDIRIGNIRVKDLSMNDLNALISYVDQNTFLFNDSIMENIRVGKRGASKDEIIAAAKKAACHDFIIGLPRGYDTITGDRLSGGERQRIAIARAILKNSPIVILDEATSSTDIENEEKIQEALLEFTKDKTVVQIVRHNVLKKHGLLLVPFVVVLEHIGDIHGHDVTVELILNDARRIHGNFGAGALRKLSSMVPDRT